MATGNVSSTNITPWTSLASITTTSGTSATLITGLAGYGKLMVVWNNVQFTTNNTATIRFNGVSTNYASQTGGLGGGGGTASNTAIVIDGSNYGVQSRDGYIIINDVLSSGPKTVQGLGVAASSGSNSGPISGVFNNTNPITSITIQGTSTTDAFTAGTVTLYGIAA